MTVRKLSIALDVDVAEAAAAAAGARGISLSAWLNNAAAAALTIEDGLVAVGEWEAEHGALTDEELEAADAVLDRTAKERRDRRSA